MWESPGFVDFFRAFTPVDELELLALGSRPARRPEGPDYLESLRAIPWVFGWTQNRTLLPAWYGCGSAFASAEPAELARLYDRLPFFRSLVDNLEMTLAKSSLEVAREYLELVPARLGPEAFFERIAAEHERTVAAVLAIVGRGAPARAQPRRSPLDRDPEPLRRPDERDPGRAPAPLPGGRRERAASPRPLDRRDRGRAAQHRLSNGELGRCCHSEMRRLPGTRGNRENAGMPDAATGEHLASSRQAPAGNLPGADEIFDRAAGENFSVASILLGRDTRRHLTAIYGYARLVDQIGDAVEGDRQAALDAFEADLALIFDGGGRPAHAVLRRLEPTVHELDLPRGPFERLIEANRRDQETVAYGTFEELVGYCDLSANPVGELVLHVFGAATPDRIALSDRVCTALQLAEHWQDVAEDRTAGRVYLPAEDLDRFGVTPDDLDGDRDEPGRPRADGLRGVPGTDAARRGRPARRQAPRARAGRRGRLRRRWPRGPRRDRRRRVRRARRTRREPAGARRARSTLATYARRR